MNSSTIAATRSIEQSSGVICLTVPTNALSGIQSVELVQQEVLQTWIDHSPSPPFRSRVSNAPTVLS